MKECNGNQLLENMSATQTQKQITDFFSGRNSAKQAKTSNRMKPMVKNNQLMEMLRNGMQKNSNRVVTKASISLASLRRCRKIDDVQYLYTAKEN